MEVNLVSYSQPDWRSTGDDTHPPTNVLENLVAYCARVSNPSNQMNTETNDRLLKYLKRNAHWSPFEMVSICLEIKTTRDIARQILRHRSFSFQEFSQRYANPQEMGADYFVYREARLQDEKNRQNSIDTTDSKLQAEWYLKQAEVIRAAKDAYGWAIENGIAKEQARCVLPEGNTKSRLYMSGTLRSWIHYVDLRSAHGTQKEHMEIAKECGKVITRLVPNIFGGE